MNQCFAKTGKDAKGKRCSRTSGYGFKCHFCKTHAGIYEKGANVHKFNASNYHVFYRYTYHFPGTHPRAIAMFRREMRKKVPEKSAKIIQKAFRMAISNPSYRMCRERLMREFNLL